MFAGVGDVQRRKLIFIKWLLCIKHGITGFTRFSINSVTYHNRRWKIEKKEDKEEENKSKDKLDKFFLIFQLTNDLAKF